MGDSLEIYNKLTRKTKVIPARYYSREPFDIITRIIPDKNVEIPFSQRRVNCLKDMIDELSSKETGENQINYVTKSVDTLGNLKDRHFNQSRTIDDVLIDKELLTTQEPAGSLPSHLVECLSDTLQKMAPADFQMFIELAYNLEPIVNMVLQPYVILIIGYKSFASCLSLLYSENGLLNLIKKAIIYSKELNSFSYRWVLRSLTQSPIRITTCIGVALGTVIVGYGLTMFATKSQIGPITTIKAPQRFGGGISNYVDLCSLVLEKIGSELAILAGSFSKGFFGTFSSSLRETIEQVVQGGRK